MDILLASKKMATSELSLLNNIQSVEKKMSWKWMVMADNYYPVQNPLRTKPFTQLDGTVSFFFSKVWLSVIKIERGFMWPYLDLTRLKANRERKLETSLRWSSSPHLLLKHISQPSSWKWLVVLGLLKKHWGLSMVAQNRLQRSGTAVSRAREVPWVGEATWVWSGRRSGPVVHSTHAGPGWRIGAFRSLSPLLPGPILCVCFVFYQSKSEIQLFKMCV